MTTPRKCIECEKVFTPSVIGESRGQRYCSKRCAREMLRRGGYTNQDSIVAYEARKKRMDDRAES